VPDDVDAYCLNHLKEAFGYNVQNSFILFESIMLVQF
jgi:hypothetical protein